MKLPRLVHLFIVSSDIFTLQCMVLHEHTFRVLHMQMCNLLDVFFVYNGRLLSKTATVAACDKMIS